jgi:hypothetical protein
MVENAVYVWHAQRVMGEANKTRRKTTIYLDDALLLEALEVTGANTTDTIRQGLEALIRKAAYQRMRSLLGSEKGRPIHDVPRRREPATRAPRRKSA